MKTTKQISLILSEDFLRVIDEYSKNKQISRASVLRESVADHIGYQLKEEDHNIHEFREYHNGILIDCKECGKWIDEMLERGEPFETHGSSRLLELAERRNDPPLTIREFFLECVITALCDRENIQDFPQQIREKVTDRLLKHGQFGKGEIVDLIKK